MIVSIHRHPQGRSRNGAHHASDFDLVFRHTRSTCVSVGGASLSDWLARTVPKCLFRPCGCSKRLLPVPQHRSKSESLWRRSVKHYPNVGRAPGFPGRRASRLGWRRRYQLARDQQLHPSWRRACRTGAVVDLLQVGEGGEVTGKVSHREESEGSQGLGDVAE